MELAALSSQTVLRDADVFESRERSRQKRLARLALFLGVVAAFLWARTAVGLAHYFRARHLVSLTHRAGASAAQIGHDLAGAATNFVNASNDLGLPHLGLPWYITEFLPQIILMLLLVIVIGGPLLLAGRSPHVLYRPEEIGTCLADVVGAGPVVDEVVKTLNLFLAHRTFEEGMGGRPRRAVLFEGPPGTGKTYIAKAMAAEAGVPFLFVSSSAFQSMYYGQTNRKIRSYFRALQAYARNEGGAIGFIEEIDAIGASRGGMGAGPGREGIAGVVNELLIQLQSFDIPPRSTRMVNALIDVLNQWLPAAHRVKKRPVQAANFLVIGATNRAGDLDPALLRPGRFDKTIRVDIPSRSGRREIIDYYLARKTHEAELDEPATRDALAGSTFGYSPVMLEHLLDEALVVALREGRPKMSWSDVQKARLTNELGMTQAVSYTEAERRTIATHEAGHATVAFHAAPGRRLDVLSIIKRSEALGMLAHSETEERFTRSKAECWDLLRICMGGMAAEEMYFGQASTGPAGDLVAATRLACQMVGAYGMGGSLVSVMASQVPGDVVSKVLGDDECRRAVEGILAKALDEAHEVLCAHGKVLEALRDALLARDELVGDEITAIALAAEAGITVVAAARGPLESTVAG